MRTGERSKYCLFICPVCWGDIAPEMFASSQGARSGYGRSIDWWSLGVTVCEVLTGTVRKGLYK